MILLLHCLNYCTECIFPLRDTVKLSLEPYISETRNLRPSQDPFNGGFSSSSSHEGIWCWYSWIITKCLFHMEHRHVCVAAGGFLPHLVITHGPGAVLLCYCFVQKEPNARFWQGARERARDRSRRGPAQTCRTPRGKRRDDESPVSKWLCNLYSESSCTAQVQV